MSYNNRKKAGIAAQKTRGTYERNQRIVERLKAGETYAEIGADFGITWQRVQQIGWSYQVERPERPVVTGPDHPSWKGGRSYDGGGYVLVYAPDHPRARAGRVQEHILVIEEKIGRRVRRSEHVHHINGVKDDNRPDNLIVLSPGEHARLHNLRHTDGLLLDWLRWLGIRLGHTPRSCDIAEALPISFVAFHHRFGSLCKATSAAGMSPNGVGGAGHGGTPLPLNFRKQYAHLRQYATPEALAEELHGGVLSGHERHLQESEAA